jgi:hypothetical protein
MPRCLLYQDCRNRKRNVSEDEVASAVKDKQQRASD